jgi:uncharacterized protein with beta-barrel porin domain
MTKKSRSLKNVLRTSTAFVALAAASLLTAPAHAIVGNDAYPPASLVDPTNITGVGQMVVDEGDGYVGLCTVSLINPRTVIFASHCVNEAPASAYGTANDGIPIGFGFQAYNRTPLINWLFGDHQSSAADAFYNSNYVVYNQHSLDLGPSNNFLQGDIAMAALDMPAVGIPTWTLLFSPLTEPTHATIEGYGNYGTGTDGYIDLDFRRRVAENTISFLGSLDDVDTFLFGSPDGLPQNLYQLDFNDPKFNTEDANYYDFNIFHDAALEKEAITAPGDSGGPLIVDQLFDKPVIAAVLSGGSRFFYEQPSAAYGTTSFYQPLYLFWDWIIQNNPYKYVSAKAGNGLWSDPSHWQIDLDPNYVTIVDGELVNALPEDAAQGIPPVDGVNTPKFGQVCYFDICEDIATGEVTGEGAGSGAAAGSGMTTITASSPARVALDTLVAMANGITNPVAPAAGSSLKSFRQAFLDRGLHSASAIMDPPSVDPASLPSLPGDSGFVPDDTDGDSGTGAPPRYYDVTLSANGTTTLDEGFVIIDRLTINGAKTGLNIGANAAMGTWIDTTMYAGNFNVDGLYISLGDIALMGGVLSGNGAVLAPYVTTVLGAIAPGTVGTIGNLEIDADVVLSSGSGLLMDVGPNNTSDFLDVYGTLALGGTLVVTPTGGYVPKWHQTRTVAAADAIVGSFTSVVDTVTGVLYPTVKTVTVGEGSEAYKEEVVTFEAASFASLLSAPSTDQKAIGGALDKARATEYTNLQALYDAIDPLDEGALGSALESMAPDTARTVPEVAQMLTQAYSGFLWNYLGGMSHSGEAQVAVQTGALKMAQNSMDGSYRTRNLLTSLGTWDTGAGSMNAPVNPLPAEGGAMALPKGVGAFLSGEVIDGSALVGGNGGKANIDGYLVAFGFDMPLSERFRLGVSVGFGDATAKLVGQPAQTTTNMTQAVLYGQYDIDGYFLNGFAGAGALAASTERDTVVGSTVTHLKGHTGGTSPLLGLQLGRVFDIEGANVMPAIGIQYARPDFNGYSETGGLTALTISNFSKEEMNARIGFDANFGFDLGSVKLKPDVHAFFVTNLDNSDVPSLNAAFAAIPDSAMAFELERTSISWVELGVGTSAELWEGASLGVHYNATPGRGDVNFSAWSGSFKVKF